MALGLSIIKDISVKRVIEADEDKTPRSELFVGGQAKGKFVSGAVLEAAVQYDSFYLIFMTDDVPFEEMLSIHLLDVQLNVLDSAVIGGPYSTGSFSSLELIEPSTLRFRFIGDTTWSVELLPRRMFRIPFISEPLGVWRRFGFTRHFVVRGNPRPESPIRPHAPPRLV